MKDEEKEEKTTKKRKSSSKESDLREIALGNALYHANAETPASEVVANAEIYYAFLKGTE